MKHCDPQMFAIIAEASMQFKMPHKEIVKKGAQAHRIRVRRWIAIKAREQGISFPRIGAALHRDHATVINMVRPRSGRITFPQSSR